MRRMRPCRCARFCAAPYLDYFRLAASSADNMDYEAILGSARREAGAEFVVAFARDLAYEWCEIYEAMSNRTTNVVRFQCGTFEYLYDDYASLEAAGRVPYDRSEERR